MPSHLSRSGFLTAAVTLAAAPSALAEAPDDRDLADARLLLAVELLLIDFYGRALEAKRFAAAGGDALRRAHANEQEHLASVAKILTGAGQVATAAGDIDFRYPARTFDSRGSIASLAVRLETLAVGAYLGAVASIRSQSLAGPLARIAASEAQHLAVFSGEATGHYLGQSFPEPLPVADVSNALDRYTS